MPSIRFPLNARVVLSDVKLDGATVTMIQYSEPTQQVDYRCSVMLASHGGTAVRLIPPRKVTR
jgi:hypothetical protein